MTQLRIEIFNVERTPLTRILIAQVLLRSLRYCLCWLHIEFHVGAHVLPIEPVHRLLGGRRPAVLGVFNVGDECKFSFRVGLLSNAVYLAEGLEKLLELLVRIVDWIVTHIQIIWDAAFILRALLSEGYSRAFFALCRFLEILDRQLRILGIVVGNKAVPARNMSLVHRNLDRLGSPLFSSIERREHVVQLGGDHSFGDVPDKDTALFVCRLEIHPEKSVVEWKPTTLFTLDLKVAENLTGPFKFIVVCEGDHARVEWLSWVPYDFRRHLHVYALRFE